MPALARESRAAHSAWSGAVPGRLRLFKPSRKIQSKIRVEEGPPGEKRRTGQARAGDPSGQHWPHFVALLEKGQSIELP